MAHNFSSVEAGKAENRELNRYRDVYPYDHSRVTIRDLAATDYINASLVKVKDRLRREWGSEIETAPVFPVALGKNVRDSSSVTSRPLPCDLYREILSS